MIYNIEYRKDLEKEKEKAPAEGKEAEDLTNWSWMDPTKKQQLANMESQMLDEYTQSIIKNGLRPMFEFNFFQVWMITMELFSNRR